MTHTWWFNRDISVTDDLLFDWNIFPHVALVHRFCVWYSCCPCCSRIIPIVSAAKGFIMPTSWTKRRQFIDWVLDLWHLCVLVPYLCVLNLLLYKIPKLRSTIIWSICEMKGHISRWTLKFNIRNFLTVWSDKFK